MIAFASFKIGGGGELAAATTRAGASARARKTAIVRTCMGAPLLWRRGHPLISGKGSLDKSHIAGRSRAAVAEHGGAFLARRARARRNDRRQDRRFDQHSDGRGRAASGRNTDRSRHRRDLPPRRPQRIYNAQAQRARLRSSDEPARWNGGVARGVLTSWLRLYNIQVI